MLVFGPYSAIPQNEEFVVYNLTSLTQFVPRLNGLIPKIPQNIIATMMTDQAEYTFDVWYYDYVTSDPDAVSSILTVLGSLYNGQNVYICITEYSDAFLNMINESFMKVLQTRYGIRYAIINNALDYEYLDHSGGCDFTTVDGIMQFDRDKMDYLAFIEENNIMRGGVRF